MYENRTYAIITAEQAQQIDFSQVMETSLETLRFSVDGTKTFVKYGGQRPSSVPADASTHTHEEILEILSTPEWTAPLSEGMGI
jgi:hypothetical protein